MNKLKIVGITLILNILFVFLTIINKYFIVGFIIITFVQYWLVSSVDKNYYHDEVGF